MSTDYDSPTITDVKVRELGGIAGNLTFLVTVKYDNGDGWECTLHGSVYGSPGTVIAELDGRRESQLYVINPGRFGARFDAEYARRYGWNEVVG